MTTQPRTSPESPVAALSASESHPEGQDSPELGEAELTRVTA